MKIICDWKNCKEIGSYKAPMERDNSKKYRLLCLNHIKEFNKNWNYFENMNDQEIEFFIKSDLTWHKSTKKFGSSENFFNILWNNALDDKLNIFKSSNFRDFKKTKISQTDKDALNVMQLNEDVKWEQIHSKFKELVKKYHPDKNLGDKKFEDNYTCLQSIKKNFRKKMNSEQLVQKPDIKLSVKQTFGFDSDMKVGAFSKKNDYVPKIDPDYKFDKDTTLAILAGFSFNKRVLIQGYHGTGKSTHIEQVAARLNWPCIRVNLDSHISRIDLIGKDSIVLKEGKQITEFKEGILPWSIQNPIALVFDEYDAGRPDVMFVIQRVLESEGNFTLLDKNKVLEQHDFFRIFATTNTVGLGDTTGLYHGTQQINQGQMDRWNIVSTLNYLPFDKELEIVLAKNKVFNSKEGKEILSNMIKVADLTRKGFINGDISTVMSPRTVLHWAENTNIFKDKGYAFRITFLNKCDDLEKKIISEYFQRCFGEDLPESSINVSI